MSDYQTVATVDEIPEGQGKVFEVNDRAIAVFNIGGKLTAIDDMCPHMGASLCEGDFNDKDSTVACPWHGWRFNVVDGSWADNPRIRTDVFDVKVVGDEIQVSARPRGKEEL